MKFEEMMSGLRMGKKYRRMGKDTHIRLSTGAFSGKLVIITVSNENGESSFTYITSHDLLAEDWVEYSNIVKANMYLDTYFVACPNCKEKVHVGTSWETHVGDTIECECGNTILLCPPVEYCNPPENNKELWQKNMDKILMMGEPCTQQDNNKEQMSKKDNGSNDYPWPEALKRFGRSMGD